MRKRKIGKTYTKILTKHLIWIGIVGGFIPYILSFCDKEPAVELGIAWITEVVAIGLGYFVRGFKDTKAMAEHEYNMERLDIEREERNGKKDDI